MHRTVGEKGDTVPATVLTLARELITVVWLCRSFIHSAIIGLESLSVVRRTCPNPMVATNLTSELENLCRPGYNSVSIF